MACVTQHMEIGGGWEGRRDARDGCVRVDRVGQKYRRDEMKRVRQGCAVWKGLFWGLHPIPYLSCIRYYFITAVAYFIYDNISATQLYSCRKKLDK